MSLRVFFLASATEARGSLATTATPYLQPTMSEKLYAYLKNRLAGDQVGSAWINGLRLNLDGDTLHVAFLHPYFFDWFIRRHAILFERLARQYAGDLKVVYHREGMPAPPAQTAKRAKPS